MLGRLFKLTSTQSLNLTLLGSGGTQTGSPNSFDDSYTRGILYGSAVMLLPPVHLSMKRFRLVVAQDGGALAAKQILYDLFGDSALGSPLESPSASPLAGSDLPNLHHKLSQVSLHSGQSRSVPHTSVSLPVSLDAFLSPDVAELANALQLPNSHYFSREHGHGVTNTASHGSAGAVRMSAGGLSLRAGINRNVVLQKPAHNINVLTDYMFGRGLPSNEWHTASKIHILPPLNLVHGTSQAILVTRLFLIVDANAVLAHEPEPLPCASWSPKSTIHARESTVQFASQRLAQLRLNFTSRFSIGIIIPFDDPSQTVEETLASNWPSLSIQFVSLQRAVAHKLIQALKNGPGHHSPYICNKRIQFPSYMLQGDLELLIQLKKLIKLIYFQANVPRLISNHSLMVHTLNHKNSPYKANMINWALEVINWLEFKDGRNSVSGHIGHSNLSSNLVGSFTGLTTHLSARSTEGIQLSNTFLASLFALIMPLRESLSARTLETTDEDSDVKEITRVVVMTSNSTVAKKLIFLLCGLIPDAKFLYQLDNTSTSPSFASSESESQEREISTRDLPLHPFNESLKHSSNQDMKVSTGPKLETFLSQRHALSESPRINSDSPLNLVRPIPIQRQVLSESEVPSDDSVCASVSSTKGWEVPAKSTTCASFSKSSTTPVPTKSVAISQKPVSSERSGNGSSMAYLSSSLNSSLSSSASNYSLLKLGNSFMDKWKHSLVGSNSFTPHNVHESFEPPMFIDSLRKIGPPGTKSPSPATLDDHAWPSHPMNSATSSPSRPRFSRTQSVFNVCNDTLLKTRESSLKLSTPNVERTVHSIIIPSGPAHEKSMKSRNEQLIRDRISRIFLQDVEIISQNELSIILKDPFEKQADDLAASVGPLYSSPYQRRLFLQPHVAFVEEFRPECVIQSCPANPKLETQVINAMKNDLIFYQNNCNFKKVVSKTVFISLRARDIKLIELKVGGQDKSPNSHFGPTTPTQEHAIPIGANSPISSYFGGHDSGQTVSERRGSVGANNYKTSIRRVFSPGRNSGDKELINLIENQLERLTEVVAVMNGDQNAPKAAKQELNKMLFDAVRAIIT